MYWLCTNERVGNTDTVTWRILYTAQNMLFYSLAGQEKSLRL